MKMWINDLSGHGLTTTKAYKTWKGVLDRCYSDKVHTRFPTYTECSIAPEWLTFSNFKKWYDENYREGFELDKDILIEGNKVYSPETCIFVPSNINRLLLNRSRFRGDLPLGVAELKSKKCKRVNSKYLAQCSNGDGKILAKAFKTIEEASTWYSATKTRVVREVAQKALDAEKINKNVFDALVSRIF